MDTIRLEVWLYGPLARYSDNTESKSHAKMFIEMPQDLRMRDILELMSLPTEERGMTFINGNLCAMPGLQPDMDHSFKDGDRVAFFHLKSMWPFQYRDGAAMAPELKTTLDSKKKRHHLNKPGTN
ncbi:hypothetical protein LCGC14_2923500 [marine sediment metagenome]|uniref:MoaD/ThiS family protein n=1 Tax=marine sediment metagenome TaxID=412755 RepID=A0A0F9AE56_9ZZZZ